MKSFKDRLHEAIIQVGITASELSKISGVGKSDISNYMKGKYLPKQDKCYLLASALNVDAGWLMTGVEPREEVRSISLHKNEQTEEEKVIDAYWKAEPIYREIALDILLKHPSNSNETAQERMAKMLREQMNKEGDS